MKMTDAQRLAEYKIALRSLIVEASHYPDALYPALAREHLQASIVRARAVQAGEQWQPGQFEIDQQAPRIARRRRQ